MPLKPDRSAFLDALDWLDLPAQGVMNLLKGNVGGAGRNVADLFGGIADLGPGDYVPQFSRPEDKTSGHEFFGVDRDAHPFYASVADASVALLNPLTYLGFGKGRGVTLAGKTIAGAGKTLDPLTLAGKAASMGIDQLPASAAKNVRGRIQSFKETLGWISPEMAVADLAHRADATANGVGKAKELELAKVLDGTDPEQRKRAFKLIQNYDRTPDGQVVALGPDASGTYGTHDQQVALLKARAARTGWTPDEQAAAVDLASRASLFERMNFHEAVQDAPVFHSKTPDQPDLAPMDYAQRLFQYEDAPTANALKGRVLSDKDTFVDFLQKNPDVHLEEDIGVALAHRASQQGRMMKRAIAGQELIDRGQTGAFGPKVQAAVQQVLERRQLNGSPLAGNRFSDLSDVASRGAVSDVIDQLKVTSPDDARVLQTVWHGLEPRSGVTADMANLNRLFKPAAVMGVGWPGKPAAVMRNIIAFPGQVASEEELGFKHAMKQAARTPAAIGHAFGVGFDQTFGTDLTRGTTLENRRLWDKALSESGGRVSAARAALKSAGREDVLAAVEHGVIDNGFVNQETMERPIRDSRFANSLMDKVGFSPSTKKRVFDWAEAPATSFQGAEEFARSNTFYDKRKELIAAGVDPGEANMRAAAATRSAYLDYSGLSGEKARTLSDWVPFAKFTTGSVKQGAQFISRVPGVGTTLAGLYGQDEDEPIYPYLQEQLHVRAGRDEKGNSQYLSGLGLPIEALNQVPNIFGDSSVRALGRDVERIVGGSAQPLAKTAYGAIAGHDPFFDTKFMSYDKLPVVGHAGQVGRVVNAIAGTGLVQPLVTPLNILGKITDPRQSAGTKALDLLTGANVVSVDPNLAVQQQLTKALSMDAGVRETSSLYGVNPDDDTASLLHELNALKSRARKERAAGRAAAAGTAGLP